ncbi:MAG: carboxypeptidase-like regulatory domain-containing protein, partial [Bacteroidota bacterium]|nr:carboxypeptidase-like regulatory domain-containing protein [Bacteroidota bacterium]
MNGRQYIYHRIKKRKLILFFLFCFISQIFNTPTFSQSNTLQLDLKNATIEQVLNVIEQKTSYRFLYNKQSINVSRKVTVVGKKLEVPNILNEIFSGTDIYYSINGKQIVLIKREKKNSEPINRKITGHVTDEKGESVIGAIVFVEGMANKGTITDSEGKFVLEVPAGVKIEVRNVGYLTQEFQVDEKEAYDIKLEEDVKKLDEVVVIGYGSQKKESVVGAISQTTNKDLQRTGNVTDLKQALTGQLPGLITITSSGEPGGTQDGQSATAIYIRGQNSWNGGQPLILVDGVERGMENVDVNEVQSISVLKDASATAVFGVKGANGVILITTKRGAKGRPQISFNYNATAITPSKLPQKLDSYSTLLIKDAAIEREVPLNESSWADYMPTEIVDRYKQPQTAEYAMIYPNVDWRKAMFKDVSFSHRAAINVEGGSDFVQYFGSLTYLHEGDMFKD